VDLLVLLDRLEEVLGTGRKLPFRWGTVVDEDECLDILDQIRVAVPDEIKAAKRVAGEREQMMAEAQAEADRLLQEAEQRAHGRLSDHALVRAAEERAAVIEDEALRAADDIRREADAYAARVLERLRGQVDRVGKVIDDGLASLRDEEPPEPNPRGR
jgi:cell division septum initiation protein DivIVA